MEPALVKYKIKISITESDDVPNNYSSINDSHEFEFYRYEANKKYNKILRDLQSKFSDKLLKVWISTQSISKNQFGYLIDKTDCGWMIFFPNGQGHILS